MSKVNYHTLGEINKARKELEWQEWQEKEIEDFKYEELAKKRLVNYALRPELDEISNENLLNIDKHLDTPREKDILLSLDTRENKKKIELLVKFFKIFKIKNKDFFDIKKKDPIQHILKEYKEVLKLYFLEEDNDYKQYIVKTQPDWEAGQSISVDSKYVFCIEDEIAEYFGHKILQNMIDELLDSPIYLKKN